MDFTDSVADGELGDSPVEDLESRAFRESIERSPEDLPDFGDYGSRLAEARTADFTGIEDKNCVGHGFDSVGRPCIYLVPALALQDCEQDNDAKLAMMRKIMLLFIKHADYIVNEPYTLVYGHSATPLLAQTAVLHSYYKILPRKYKKNLKEMVLLHPTFGIRTFFEISRYFVGEKFFRKLHFISRISQFQHVIPPPLLRLPFSFISWEERHLKMSKKTGRLKALSDLVNPEEGITVPYFLNSCADFLRRNNAFNQEGIFRVPGDQVFLKLAIDRIRLDGGNKLLVFGLKRSDSLKSDSSTGEPCAVREVPKCKNAEEFKTLTTETNLVNGVTTAPEVSIEIQNFTDEKLSEIARINGHAVLLVEEINSGAQLFKSFLNELPEPVLCYSVYDELVQAARDLDSGGSIEAWRDRVTPLLTRNMPEAHVHTLQFVLKFLAEVCLSANINKMTPHNLAIVFSPNMMRPRVDDPLIMAKDMKYCVKTVETLLMEHMNDSLRASIAHSSGGRSGLGQRFSAIRNRNSDVASSFADTADLSTQALPTDEATS